MPPPMARRVAARPNGMTSTGSGKRPSASTHLESSAITIMRSDAAATIFSRSKAPPPPLMRLSAGSISSAPSTVRSSRSISSSVVRAMPHRAASARVASEVGTPMTLSPARTRSPKQFDEMLRGRTGAEAKLHAVAHGFERARRRLPFQFVHSHVKTLTRPPPRGMPAGISSVVLRPRIARMGH